MAPGKKTHFDEDLYRLAIYKKNSKAIGKIWTHFEPYVKSRLRSTVKKEDIDHETTTVYIRMFRWHEALREQKEMPKAIAAYIRRQRKKHHSYRRIKALVLKKFKRKFQVSNIRRCCLSSDKSRKLPKQFKPSTAVEVNHKMYCSALERAIKYTKLDYRRTAGRRRKRLKLARRAFQLHEQKSKKGKRETT